MALLFANVERHLQFSLFMVRRNGSMENMGQVAPPHFLPVSKAVLLHLPVERVSVTLSAFMARFLPNRLSWLISSADRVP